MHGQISDEAQDISSKFLEKMKILFVIWLLYVKVWENVC